MTELEQARQWLTDAKSLAVLTGAGISAESGVPTFRGAEGLWKEYKPEDLATPEAFAKDPRLVWEWYNWRREIIKKAQPNAAHKALVKLEIRIAQFTLITQNVDGLHDMAGSGKILKLHGDIWRLRCMSCGANWPDRRAPASQTSAALRLRRTGSSGCSLVWRTAAGRHDEGGRARGGRGRRCCW